ncbi:hypothetical protein ACR5KS_03560 [Leucobacter sp. W1153]|uniref:hypothetical protein n=1 Tax=Leucobacter sp. W1153 TaxID=3439064 RepID=UPI003F2F33A1
MTDGRIPGKWVSEPRFAEMPDAIFGFLARAIAWSNEAGTDGHVKRRYLAQLHASGEVRPHAYKLLEDEGIWKATPDGYQFIDWDKKAHHGGLGQELAANVRAYKERKKANQQRYRDKGASRPVTGHVTGSVADHVGQDRNTSSGSGSGSRDIQGGSLKTSHSTVSTGVKFGTDRQGTGDGDGDGDGDRPPAVATPLFGRVPASDPGYCSHGVTVDRLCRHCPTGLAQSEVA